jgi:tetratricopeptide (TPR) repeat protein
MPMSYWRFKLYAMGLLLLGRSASAEKVFDAMLARWPEDAYALSSRSFLRAQLGRRDAAIEDARRLVNAHPEHGAGAWFWPSCSRRPTRSRRRRPPSGEPWHSTPSSTGPGTAWAWP